jgi:hypothetical protein
MFFVFYSFCLLNLLSYLILKENGLTVILLRKLNILYMKHINNYILR